MTQTTHHTGLHEQTKHRLQELGMELPTPSTAVASYVAATRIGNTVYTSGQLPHENGVLAATGKVGADLDHARSAVGVAELPLNAPVEVELIVEFS
ncbi:MULTISPECIES: RidA family protein [Arthrobacter]|uniref:RidA family protein n=1 Tax=Arthrobacter terricola TaxID=2547396 RepID=A0A4R5KEN7_9MICC|nr:MULTISPECIES: RidA family protein [Arthrobacter]MBT8161742.1 RidA family protein [Arthrobacter sp. GN70]TDF92687.1 RidA family protein [Arthrobacter terricola]